MSILRKLINWWYRTPEGVAPRAGQVPAVLRAKGPSPKLLTTDDETREWYAKNHTCPDCGGEEFYEGPSGGMSTNIKCATETCGSQFNIALWDRSVIQFDRIRWTNPETGETK